MKFKNVKTLSLLLAAAVMSLTSCNEQQLTPDVKPDLSGKTFYLSGALALPSTPGTRSATDDGPKGDDNKTNSDAKPDFELGYDYENAVHTMILVFANEADNAFINYTTVTGIAAVPKSKILTEQFDFTLTAELQYEDLEKAYGEGGPLSGTGEKNVNVFAFCNYSQDLLNQIKNVKIGAKNWPDELKGEVKEETQKAPKGSIWGEEQFLMTNAKIVKVKFPKELDDWDPYSYRDNPYFLHKEGKEGQPKKNDDGKLQVTPANYTPIVVERAAARFDFKDGSKGDNTYPLYVDQDYNNVIDPETDWNLVSIQLKEMSLVNMSQNYYSLRRVSDDGTNKNWDICGSETGKLVDDATNKWEFNYVVDTDWELKQTKEGINEGNAYEHFNFHLFTENKKYNTSAWDTYPVETVLNGKEDTWTETHSYHIWRYVTENTIPADTEGKYSQQKTVQSTGVVFKGQIKLGSEYKNGQWDGQYGAFITKGAYDAIKASEAPKDEEKDEPQEAPTLYSYNNCLYSGIGELIAKVKVVSEDGSIEWRVGDPLYVLLTNIFTELNKGVTIENFTESALDTEAKKAFNNKAAQLDPDNGISVYEPDAEDGNYYCYYFYWNRHNDNGNPAKMGPMEFCVVRNNVYKLSVVKIDRIGHPTDPDNDPDPVDPEDPDEEAIRYCAVKVEVLPWVVRENEIKF